LTFLKTLMLCIPFVAELFENGFMLREGGLVSYVLLLTFPEI